MRAISVCYLVLAHRRQNKFITDTSQKFVSILNKNDSNNKKQKYHNMPQKINKNMMLT